MTSKRHLFKAKIRHLLDISSSSIPGNFKMLSKTSLRGSRGYENTKVVELAVISKINLLNTLHKRMTQVSLTTPKPLTQSWIHNHNDLLKLL